MGTTQERVFQDDIIRQMVANGWVQGTGEGYNRESALFEADQKKVPTINEHLGNIYKKGELVQHAIIRNFRIVRHGYII